MKFGVPELLIILAVIVLLFGPTQIPRLTKMIGKGVKNFRSGMNDDEDDDSETEKKSETKSDKKAKKSKKADKESDEEE